MIDVAIYVLCSCGFVYGIYLAERALAPLSDAACSNCRYSLKGLPEDSLRCPECGVCFSEHEPFLSGKRILQKPMQLVIGILLAFISMGGCCGSVLIAEIQQMSRLPLNSFETVRQRGASPAV